ncbi:hypothetical protein PHLCEN_2v593 [Hermanssonia centrifuga]|uniref:Uncharacterized protein n=1 Tax=Hermanssonia centrifuga TaxID=98765 RepID=A0A2R6S5L1_9APHY|nr:hypothetical protein PHLCEN_2v593 [Hermanssonia centrifuga]
MPMFNLVHNIGRELGDNKVLINAILTLTADSFFVSPRTRAHRTFHLLFDHLKELPKHVITEEAREWDYGEYEGLRPAEIKAKNPTWVIWNDGCPGGESAEEMRSRVDGVIEKVCEFRLEIVIVCAEARRSESITDCGLKRVKGRATSSS